MQHVHPSAGKMANSLPGVIELGTGQPLSVVVSTMIQGTCTPVPLIALRREVATASGGPQAAAMSESTASILVVIPMTAPSQMHMRHISPSPRTCDAHQAAVACTSMFGEARCFVGNSALAGRQSIVAASCHHATPESKTPPQTLVQVASDLA